MKTPFFIITTLVACFITISCQSHEANVQLPPQVAELRTKVISPEDTMTYYEAWGGVWRQNKISIDKYVGGKLIASYKRQPEWLAFVKAVDVIADKPCAGDWYIPVEYAIAKGAPLAISDNTKEIKVTYNDGFNFELISEWRLLSSHLSRTFLITHQICPASLFLILHTRHDYR